MNSIKTMLLGIAILIVAVYIKQEGIFYENEEFILVGIGSVLTLIGFVKTDLDEKE
ncbi:hypothetical protein [Filobacillus milosensis]|uniref:hypothetical protein n=1 Tax=Filobacillus milosensis TaxID=94137 RepID=UPI00129B83AB|nr:hypothetical protein [Filobacillus milosensis]